MDTLITTHTTIKNRWYLYGFYCLLCIFFTNSVYADTTTKPQLNVIKLALNALKKAQQSGIHTDKSIITIVDYSRPSNEQRLWVLDTKQNKILHTSLVAHGHNSGNKYTTSFSNRQRSAQTSLGLFITGNTYFGKHGYSLKMIGLERGYNDNAENRAIVVHGAPYVSKKFISTTGRIGRSHGCIAIESPLVKPIINTIKQGTLIFAYYPDKVWLAKSRFI